MRADLNIKYDWKKNADRESYFNLNEMKMVVIFSHQKICAR